MSVTNVVFQNSISPYVFVSVLQLPQVFEAQPEANQLAKTVLMAWVPLSVSGVLPGSQTVG